MNWDFHLEIPFTFLLYNARCGINSHFKVQCTRKNMVFSVSSLTIKRNVMAHILLKKDMMCLLEICISFWNHKPIKFAKQPWGPKRTFSFQASR